MAVEYPIPKTGGGRLKMPAAIAAFCLHLAAAMPLLLAADRHPPEEPVTVEFIMLQAPPAPLPPVAVAEAVDVKLPAPQPEAVAPPEDLLPPEPEKLPEKMAEPELPKPEPPKPKPVARPRPAPAIAAAPVDAPLPSMQPAPQPVPPQPGGVAADSYLAMLLRHLQAFRDYPYAARRSGQQGRVTVVVALQGDGAVSAASVETSSGHELLDRAALAMVRRASPFPPPPPQAPRHLRFPIDFSLQR